MLTHSKIIAQTDKHTDRHTDTCSLSGRMYLSVQIQ